MKGTSASPSPKPIAVILASLALGASCLLPAKAEVTVNFNYILWNGTGFEDSVYGPDRKAALESVVQYMLGQFSNLQSGRTLNISIAPDSTPGVLASAGSDFPGSANSYVDTAVYRNLMLGINTGGSGYDITMFVNFGAVSDSNWYVGTGVPGATQVDFRTLMLHELTHSLGFAAKINSDGSSNLGNGKYPKFSSFLQRGDTTPLLVGTSPPTFTGTTTAMTSDDIYFAGANAVAANGGNRVRMFAPASYVGSSSLSHVSNASSNLLFGSELRHVMRPQLGNGNYQRTWTLIERGMLKDLGWVFDETAPTIVSRTPAVNATNVLNYSNIVITFDDTIAIGTGNISLVNITDGGQIDIPVTDSSQVSVSGSTLTINPTSNLLDSKQYAVLIGANAIDDDAGNSFAGILVNTDWRFTIAAPDTIAPTLASKAPASGATSVAVVNNLVATFSEPIAIGTGNITLHNITDNTNTVIAVTDSSQVSVFGTVLTINPTADLLEGKSYSVQIDATAIDDLAGNSYGGISGDVTWSFSTSAAQSGTLVFADNFEPGTAGATGVGGGGTTPDAIAGYTETGTSATSKLANSTLWVRATSGTGSLSNGLVDETENSGNGFTDPSGTQAYGFRYTNSGVTSAAGKIGTLTPGSIINVSFDVVKDGTGSAPGTPYAASLVLFDSGATRTSTTAAINNTAAVLASASGSATTDGSYKTIALSYTVGNNVVDNNGATTGTSTTYLSSLEGKDIALRFAGATSSANIDNVKIRIVPPVVTNTYANWIAGYPAVGGLTAANDDFDKDGIGNALENYFGTNPAVFSAGVVATGKGGNTFTFTHPLNSTPATDITAAYLWSTDLATFNSGGATVGGTTVIFSPGTPNAGMVSVTVTVTDTVPDRLFVVIKTTRN